MFIYDGHFFIGGGGDLQMMITWSLAKRLAKYLLFEVISWDEGFAYKVSQ